MVDCIIVGGGIVGSTVATLLSREGISCCVVEVRENVPLDDKIIDPRALTITHASRNILATCGVWEQIPVDRTGNFDQIYVWDENGGGEIRFDAADICRKNLGYVVEQSIIESVFRELIAQDKTIIRECPASVESMTTTDSEITVYLNNDHQISAKLLLAADGAGSSIRNLAGIAYPSHDYRQTAIACVVSTELSHEHTARQRFLTNGPLAFLPMADLKRCGIVWSTSPDHAQHLLSLDELSFNEVLGNIIASGNRTGFPLRHAQAENYCCHRLALAGDAAHTIHPLAGQGANLGLLDAACLAEVILDAFKKGRDIGGYRVLRKYERWRKGDNLVMLKIMQGFKTLFGHQSLFIRRLRNAGLSLTDQIFPLKQWIMHHATGLSGDLPIIARNKQ